MITGCLSVDWQVEARQVNREGNMGLILANESLKSGCKFLYHDILGHNVQRTIWI